MRKLVSIVVAVAFAALVVASLAGASRKAEIMVGAKLTAKQEIPVQTVKDATASGSFAGTIVGSKLSYTLTFKGLTGAATAAHIHLGAMGKSGNVVVPICGPCKSPVKGRATLTKALLADLKTHKLYVNVHTAKNPAGEIRGQLAEH